MEDGRKLIDKVAIVTGSGSGIGRAIAIRYAQEGAKVVVADVNRAGAEAVAEEITAAGGEAFGFQVDVRNQDQVQGLVDAAVERFGRLDILVNNAAVHRFGTVLTTTPAEWDRMLGVNLAGTANACAAVLSGMVARGRGSVVTISSDLVLGGSQGDAHYATTKGAIVGLTRSLAREVAGSGVAVNTVAPGAADTPMLAAGSPWRAESFLATLPVARLVPPEEIAAAVLFLAQSGTALLGQVVSPNSGATI